MWLVKSALSVIAFLWTFKDGLCVSEVMKSKVYKNFDSPSTCFRRLNGTHQFGCSTSHAGSFGVIHMVSSTDDIDDFIQVAEAGPYMVGMPASLFQRDFISRLVASGKVSGVFVIAFPNYIPETPFSPEKVCPNSYLSGDNCNKTVPWNPYGNSLIYHDWEVPFFLIDKEETLNTIQECFQLFNLPLENQHSRSLCSLHLKAHMYAAVDSPTCLRRTYMVSFNQVKFCDPMGDQNVFLSMGNYDLKREKSVIVIAARLDTASLFDGIAPGAMSTVTGLVTLLTIAKIIRDEVNFEGQNKSIVFLLLNGEGFDYIGSTKVIYDIQQGKYPTPMSKLDLSDILLFIDISQMGGKVTYLHTTQSDEVTNNFFNDLVEAASNFKIVFHKSQTGNLPPTSLLMFSKADPSLSGVIISNYDEQFNNKFYHSVFDNANNVKYTYGNHSEPSPMTITTLLSQKAMSIAIALKKIITGEELLKDPKFQPPYELVDDLLHCYLQNSGCKLFSSIYKSDDPDLLKKPYPLYVGVTHSVNRITKITGHLLELLASPILPLNSSDCLNQALELENKTYTYVWINETCVNSTLIFTTAISPAFEIEDYDWNSGQYPTWTESSWQGQDMSLRMFLRPSRSQEWLTLVSGLLVLLFSIIIVCCLTTQRELIFPSAPSPVNC